MGYVGCKVLLASLVILDLGDVINYYDLEIVVVEDLVFLVCKGIADDLYLVDMLVADIVGPDDIDPVLAAQDIG